jgi:hypothetical protein
MIEMALLRPSKETQNKLRWSSHIEKDDAPFHLYIPKWRVPEPWPGRISVGIEPFSSKPSDFAQSPYDSENLDNQIEVLVKRIEVHTRTVKYAPFGDEKEWQIGEPYIPFSLIPPDSDFLIIEVKWDLESKGQFLDVPTYREEL